MNKVNIRYKLSTISYKNTLNKETIGMDVIKKQIYIINLHVIIFNSKSFFFSNMLIFLLLFEVTYIYSISSHLH